MQRSSSLAASLSKQQNAMRFSNVVINRMKSQAHGKRYEYLFVEYSFCFQALIRHSCIICLALTRSRKCVEIVDDVVWLWGIKVFFSSTGLLLNVGTLEMVEVQSGPRHVRSEHSPSLSKGCWTTSVKGFYSHRFPNAESIWTLNF